MSRKPPEPVARACCDLDGEVRVPFSAMVIRVCVETRDAEYRFICPECGRIVVHLIHPSMLHMMLSQPIEIEWFYLPRDLFLTHVHPPLTYDDIIDFHRELESL